MLGSHADESVDFSFTIVLITNNSSILKDLKAVISVFNTYFFLLGKLSSLQVLYLLYMAPFFTDGVSQSTERVTDSSVALGRTGALTFSISTFIFYNTYKLVYG